jgi:hypothetical protein
LRNFCAEHRELNENHISEGRLSVVGDTDNAEPSSIVIFYNLMFDSIPLR